MPKIYISLTVHENPTFLVHQLNNIHKVYKENYKVIIHISKDSTEYLEEFNSLNHMVLNMSDVIINTDRCHTRWVYILHAHISNFNFIKHEEFDKFVLMASNEFVVNKNISEHIHKYDFGCDDFKITEGNGWSWTDTILSDQQLMDLFKNHDISLYCSYHEGTFYSKKILEYMIDICEEYKDWFGARYPREEVFFPSIANTIFFDKIRTKQFSIISSNITKDLICDLHSDPAGDKFSIKGFYRISIDPELLDHLRDLDLI